MNAPALRRSCPRERSKSTAIDGSSSLNLRRIRCATALVEYRFDPLPGRHTLAAHTSYFLYDCCKYN